MKNEIKEIIDHDDYDVPDEISETEAIIYDWVVFHFGESEAENPSWNITELAAHLDEMRRIMDDAHSVYKQNNTVKYRL